MDWNLMSDNPLKDPIFVAVCGGSCSGKTTVCEIIKKKFGDKIAFISQDWYYNGGNEKTNFDHPDSIDFGRLLEDLNKLKRWMAINAPVYDFSTHSRMKNKSRHIEPRKIVVVEGILIFFMEKLMQLFNVKIFVDADSDTRYRRRLMRDTGNEKDGGRGRSIAEVNMRWTRDVKPCHEKFVEPYKRYAHTTLHNDDDNSFKQPLQVVQIAMTVAYINELLKEPKEEKVLITGI